MLRYAINYDVGDRKRDGGLNEDSVAVSTFTDGHREGYDPDRDRPVGEPIEDVTAVGDESYFDIDDVTAAEREHPPGRPPTRSVGVVALADGAGGHDAGDVASYVATTVVVEELSAVAHRLARGTPDGFGLDLPEAIRPDRPDEAALRERVAGAVVRAHREVLRYAGESGQEAYTTVVAGLYDGDKLHYGWVGDSRAYVVNRTRETASLLTRDHSVVEEKFRAGEVDAVEAATHPQGNEITRALGGSPYQDPDTASVDVETASVPLYAEDVVVVTSDGLIDAQTDARALFEEYRERDRSDDAAADVRDRIVTDETVRDVVLDAESLAGAAREYVRLANDLGGKDNLSVALLADDALPPTPLDDDFPDRSYPAAVAGRETVVRED